MCVCLRLQVTLRLYLCLIVWVCLGHSLFMQILACKMYVCVRACSMFAYFLVSVLTFGDILCWSSLTTTPQSSLLPFQSKYFLFLSSYFYNTLYFFLSFSETCAFVSQLVYRGARVLPVCLPACPSPLSVCPPVIRSAYPLVLSPFPTFSHSDIKEPKGARLLR